MDQEINNYNASAKQSELAMVQDYYKSQPPFRGYPGCVPFVPLEEDGYTSKLTVDEVIFKYVELQMPDEKSYLAILTPWEASNGPGQKFRVAGS